MGFQDVVEGAWISQPYGCVDWAGEWLGGGCGAGQTFHCGIDLACACRARVTSPRAGTVADIGLTYLGGAAPALHFDSGEWALFGHCDEAVVQVGDRVVPGQLIAYAGSRGINPATGQPTSTGCHVHYSIRADHPDETGPAGTLDPTPYLLLEGGGAPAPPSSGGGAPVTVPAFPVRQFHGKCFRATKWYDAPEGQAVADVQPGTEEDFNARADGPQVLWIRGMTGGHDGTWWTPDGDWDTALYGGTPTYEPPAPAPAPPPPAPPAPAPAPSSAAVADAVASLEHALSVLRSL